MLFSHFLDEENEGLKKRVTRPTSQSELGGRVFSRPSGPWFPGLLPH